MSEAVNPFPARAREGGRVVELDVRPELRRGEEPFQKIMATVAALGPADVLVLYATFDPVPLRLLLGGRGYDAVSEQLGPEDWRVTFRPRPPAGHQT